MKQQIASCCLARALSLTLAGLLAGIGAAQDYRAKVQGIVTDASQGAVDNARVSLRNVNINIEATKVTDSTGHYLFDFVLFLIYTATAEASSLSQLVALRVPG